jgi:hypothetical protein
MFVLGQVMLVLAGWHGGIAPSCDGISGLLPYRDLENILVKLCKSEVAAIVRLQVARLVGVLRVLRRRGLGSATTGMPRWHDGLTH